MEILISHLNSVFNSLTDLEKKSFIEFFENNLFLFECALELSRILINFSSCEVDNA